MSRQSDEPRLLGNVVNHTWQLLRCECGHSFGRICGGSGRCTRCDSSRCRVISDFDNSILLADAVSNANLPKEIAQDLASRLHSKEKKAAHSETDQGSSRSKLLRAMHDATDDNGMLSIASLADELSKLGFVETSPDYLIGQAEIVVCCLGMTRTHGRGSSKVHDDSPDAMIQLGLWVSLVYACCFGSNRPWFESRQAHHFVAMPPRHKIGTP